VKDRERRDLEVVRRVELVGGEEGVQVEVGLTHVLAVGVHDLEEGVHPEAHIHTAVHLRREVRRGGGGGDLYLVVARHVAPRVGLAALEQLLLQPGVAVLQNPAEGESAK
jgi:hypothetical protein